MQRLATITLLALLALAGTTGAALAQGVTTSAMSGFVTDTQEQPLPGANVVAVHVPTGTQYGTTTNLDGVFNLRNMRVGGPYTVTVSFIGFRAVREEGLMLGLGETEILTYELAEESVELGDVVVVAEGDDVLDSDRTGAATYLGSNQVDRLPSVKRSTRDLTRVDPRSDGNFSFGGRNWLYNNVSLDGSYFNNSFGLDDPAPGGQTGAEPVPFDAVEQVQVSVAPFDVREGGFTGANINTVTKSGTNEFKSSVYSYYRNEDFQGNTVSGEEVFANPELTFNQTGATFSGPIVKDKVFFFVNGEIERRDDPGTNFQPIEGGTPGFGETRVEAPVLDAIRQRMIEAYDYDPGAYDGFVNETKNNKLLAKLDWNVNANNSLTFRWNYLDASRQLPPHPFAISFNNTGRGPNASTLPFQGAGYTINNELHSFALELNSRGSGFSNRFFASYNRFRDFREANSEPFPTVEIAENGVSYTTLGHEPFSIHNILDQDVFQVTNNFTVYRGRHVLTAGANFEAFLFFNSFNLFRHGLFMLPYFVDFEGDQIPNGSTFFSVDEFFEMTNPDLPLCGQDGTLLADAGTTCRVDFRGMVTPGTAPFKGEEIDVAQTAFYVQDEFIVSPQLNLTFGLRLDVPIFITDPVDNPYSRGLTALDENDETETIDQSNLPSPKPLLSPRLGFNYDVTGDRTTQLRGGTGIFTGRIPFVWFGNVISNPGNNPNLFPNIAENQVPESHRTSDDSILQTSFDLNAMADDFSFPQVWTTNLAVDQVLPWGTVATFEGIYTKDLNAIWMRNADLGTPVRTLADGRPYYGGGADAELNPDGGAGIYVIDNTSEGYSLNLTGQLRHRTAFGLDASLAYSYLKAENLMKTTEIASVLWQNNPVQGDPNRPGLAPSEFGQRHRIVGSANYRHEWGGRFGTAVGLFFEVAEGNAYLGAGGNRYSFTYAGDVNGDGYGGNDLIYIPASASEINLVDPSDWERLNAFIEQDDYLSANRGQIAERNGAVNPWYSNVDLRILQDVAFDVAGKPQRVQISLDILNVANLLNSDWGVRKFAPPSATSPLQLIEFDEAGEPVFDFVGPSETYIDDPSILSRWRAQFGIKYIFN